MSVPGADALGRKILQPVQPAAIPRFAHQLEVAQQRIGFHRLERWPIQRLERIAAAEFDAEIEAEAIHPQFQRPAAHRLQDQLAADRIVGGDRVAATAHIQIVAVAVLVVVVPIRQAAPAEGWPGGCLRWCGCRRHPAAPRCRRRGRQPPAGACRDAAAVDRLRWRSRGECEPVQGAVPPDVVPPLGASAGSKANTGSSSIAVMPRLFR